MKAKVLDLELERDEVVIKANDYKKFRMYLGKGYYVFKREVGYYTLRSKSKIYAFIKCENEYERIDLTKNIIQVYGKQKIEKLIEVFRNDLKYYRATLEVDSNRNYFINKK